MIVFKKHLIPGTSALLAMVALLSLPLFAHLETLPIRLWDESRLAINALEMYENGFSIVTTFDGSADMWNTKPPLMIWLQTLWMHLLGPGVLAIRLPSAIAALLTVFIVFVLGAKVSGSKIAGFATALFLVSASGYLSTHGTRTGDYDSLLTLFTTAYLGSIFLFEQGKNRLYLWLFFAFLALAALTKGVAAMLFLPALAIYYLINFDRLRQLLTSKDFYIGLLAFVLLIGSYYFARERLHNGYLQAVMQNELGGRFTETVEGHKHPWYYYLKNFYETRLDYWLWVLPFGLFQVVLTKRRMQLKFLLFLWLNVVVYLIIISMADTKLEWYDLPLYPLLALIGGQAIYWLLENIFMEILPGQVKIRQAIVLFCILAVATFPYIRTLERVSTAEDPWYEKDTHGAGHFLNAALKGDVKPGHYLIMEQGYNAHYWFYQRVLNKYREGYTIELLPYDQVSPGDEVMACRSDALDYIEENFDAAYSGSSYRCHSFKLMAE